MSWLFSMREAPQEPERPSTHNLDVEERTELQADKDYATEPYEVDYGFADNAEPEPIPVYQVLPTPTKERDINWSAATYTVGTTPIQIAGRNRNRLHVHIDNNNAAGGNPVYLGPSSLIQPYLSAKLRANKDIVMHHNDAVWAVCDTGESAEVVVFQEYYLDEAYPEQEAAPYR